MKKERSETISREWANKYRREEMSRLKKKEKEKKREMSRFF